MQRNPVIWVLSLLAAVIVGLLLQPGGDPNAAPTTAATTTTAPSTTTGDPTTTTLPATTTSIALVPSPEALAYFAAVAGSAEFGGAGVIHKWESDIHVEVFGQPGADDLVALDQVITDLNLLLPIDVERVASGGNIWVHFAPESDLEEILPTYEPGNLGFVWINWDARGVIYDGTVLISTTGTTSEERAHLLREEITQALGLLNDTFDYPDSIFYQGWTATEDYSAIDLAVIEMLYHPDIVAGMSVDEALAVLGAG